MTAGGYDAGYCACPCFWGREPSSLVKELLRRAGPPIGLRVLDAGCGEGKNAIFLARAGALVQATDISAAAIANAKSTWPDAPIVNWQIVDVRKLALSNSSFDIVIAYGLLHCLPDATEISDLVRRMQAATKAGGYHVVCAFNSRKQDLSAHPGFNPTLLNHSDYLDLYESWATVEATDSDLTESHPHNLIEHTHSMTRIIARKPNDRRSGCDDASSR